MRRIITRPGSLLIVVALAVVAALGTGPQSHAASFGSAGGTSTTARHAPAASISTPCTFVPAQTCQSTDHTVALNIKYYGNQSGCTYVWSVYWGDGNSDKDLTITDPRDGDVFLKNHTYAAAGNTYTISVAGTSGTCTANPFSVQFTFVGFDFSNLLPNVSWKDIAQALKCGVSVAGAGWTGDLKNLYDAIEVVLAGKDLAEVRTDLDKFFQVLIIDVWPGGYKGLGECVSPIISPPPAS